MKAECEGVLILLILYGFPLINFCFFDKILLFVYLSFIFALLDFFCDFMLISCCCVLTHMIFVVFIDFFLRLVDKVNNNAKGGSALSPPRHPNLAPAA